ncbi:hypothetical protein DCC85_09755 [Paenibacillus sp. CAA11]|uniref:hypothetical protein n=1 Tax=Paenibacillus sp. CAA11 TaxID=1532905 RepID=UPI000D3331DD|nr:hypothetical protein [Paenibacillus sp. CAA11]AWB44482.1 hypothetical protein DCC85_09755 [Paenibacillus sp. CAA11]
MAQQKWIKWMVGVSSALFFTGFVGYISKTDQGATVTSGNQTELTPLVGTQDSSQDEIMNQWEDNSQEAGDNFYEPGDRREGSFQGDASTDQSSSGTEERVRSRAS